MKDLDCQNLSDCTDVENVCLAHLNEGRVPDCHFTTADIKMCDGRWIMSKHGDGLGRCCDWRPKSKKYTTRIRKGGGG
jgi:hypothetical protein